jgi:hypothetical protein
MDPDELDDQQQKRVYVSLYQTHVPKLADLGVITYDSETRMVELTERATEVEEYVDTGPTSERPWQWYYLGLSVLSFVALGVAGADLPPLTNVPDIFAGAVVGLAFATLSLYHYATWRRDRQDVTEELRTRE